MKMSMSRKLNFEHPTASTLNVHAAACCVLGLTLLAAGGIVAPALAQEVKVQLKPEMVVNESELGNPQAMVDEQQLIGDPPTGKPENTWKVNSRFWKMFPKSAYVDLGRETNLSTLWHLPKLCGNHSWEFRRCHRN